VATILLALTLASLWIVFYQLLEQQGRILLNLEQIQRQLGLAATQRLEPRNRSLGEPFPSFSLPDLSGNPSAWKTSGGNRLFSSIGPQCGFCDMIAPELAKLTASQFRLPIVLLAHGSPEANLEMAEEHGLKCPILVAKDDQIPEPVKEFGTPVAYLLDAEGKVANRVAIGSEQVPALARAAADEKLEIEPAETVPEPARNGLPGKRDLSESRIERNGLKAGTSPRSSVFATFMGEQYRSETTGVNAYYWSSATRTAAPATSSAPNSPTLIVNIAMTISGLSWSAAAMRRRTAAKSRAHKLRFPVVLQSKWELSREAEAQILGNDLKQMQSHHRKGPIHGASIRIYFRSICGRYRFR
jgi:hypothetical protein